MFQLSFELKETSSICYIIENLLIHETVLVFLIEL